MSNNDTKGRATIWDALEVCQIARKRKAEQLECKVKGHSGEEVLSFSNGKAHMYCNECGAFYTLNAVEFKGQKFPWARRY